MDVDRHPRVVVDGVPDGEHRPLVRDPSRRHHERQPGIGDEHDRGAHDVEAEPETKMHQGMELPPAVVIGVEEERLEEEEQDVGKKGRGEHAHHVVGELRIQDDEHERQERAERRGERERDREQLRELVREPVVAQISGLVADDLDDEGEDRNRQNEGREQQVELGDRPDRHAAPDDGKGSVLGLHVGRRLGLGLRRCLLGRHAFRARRLVDRRGGRPVLVPVFVVAHERGDPHDRDEHHDAGDGPTRNSSLRFIAPSSRYWPRSSFIAAARQRPAHFRAACVRALARRR